MTSPNPQKHYNADCRAINLVAVQQYLADNIEQHTYCAHFGCGKVLTMTEQLYGNLCHEHSVAPKQDITKHINY